MHNKSTYKLYLGDYFEFSSESLDEIVEAASKYGKDVCSDLRIEQCTNLNVDHLIKEHSYTKYQEYLELKEKFDNLTEQESKELEEFKAAKRAWNEIALNSKSIRSNLGITTSH